MKRFLISCGLYPLSVLLPAMAGAAPAIEVRSADIGVRASEWDNVSVVDGQGRKLVDLSGFHLKWQPNLEADGGRFYRVTNPDGSEAIEVAYQVPEASAGVRPSVVGRFTPRDGRVDVAYSVTNVPEGANIGGSMLRRSFPTGAKELPVEKMGLWQRHVHGGLPIEIQDGRLLPYQIGDSRIAFAFPAGNRVNTDWKDGSSQHAGLVKQKDGSYASAFSIVNVPPQWPYEAVAAAQQGRPLALAIGTQRTYNWWDNAEQPLALDVQLVNLTQEPRTVELKHWIRNFAGEVVSEQTASRTLPAGQMLEEAITFTPQGGRDIFFAEVSATDTQSGEEVFARTNLVLLPPHEFKGTAEESIIGLSAWWPIPDEESVKALMERMGVRWLRHGNSNNFDNIVALLHNNIDWKRDYTDAERDEWIRKSLQRCIDEGNPVWEFANEINMSTAGIAQEGTGIGQALLAEKYVDWLKAIRRVQREMGDPADKVKILSFGIAGMDVKFVERMHELGGWELIDGIALHPGRGNFAPDYPVEEPWKKWTHGMYGSYWNYYGSVRTANALINKYGGDKTLWLTEIYSPGWPNSFWEDTPRNGAENVLLTQALAMAEGVEATFWYQLFDSVWWDRLGVNPKDREYYFGLMQRDLSFKATLMAFVATSEALDQATFVRWINKLPGAPNARGLLFDTPRGPMAVLWDRSDGYVLTERSDNFVSPEPWVDTWKTRVKTTVPVTGESLTQVNVIGQSETLPARSGKAELVLSGAPVVVYGIDPARL